mmetsp:Transcript_25391/g.71027  ORF Transcript_25391/g.71027 Transcript_25391/m.71027 type:complete len:249 (-) Transcript_25391:433-1179(-)
MVDEAAKVSLASGVYHLPVADVHEVVVPLSHLRVAVLPPQVLLLLQNLPDVFDDEVTLLDILRGEEPKAFGACPPHLHACVLPFCEQLVGALVGAWAVLFYTLDVQQPVEAVRAALVPVVALAHHDVVLVLLLSPAVREDVVRDELPDRGPFSLLDGHLHTPRAAEVVLGTAAAAALVVFIVFGEQQALSINLGVRELLRDLAVIVLAAGVVCAVPRHVIRELTGDAVWDPSPFLAGIALHPRVSPPR